MYLNIDKIKNKAPYIIIFLTIFYIDDVPRYLLRFNIQTPYTVPLVSTIIACTVSWLLFDNWLYDRFDNPNPFLRPSRFKRRHIYNIVSPIELMLLIGYSLFCLYSFLVNGELVNKSGYLSLYIIYKTLFYLAYLDDKN